MPRVGERHAARRSLDEHHAKPLLELTQGLAHGRARDAELAGRAREALAAGDTWIAPIPGTTKLHRLKENIGAAAIILSAEELRRIHEAVAKVEIQGARYPESLAKMVGR